MLQEKKLLKLGGIFLGVSKIFKPRVLGVYRYVPWGCFELINIILDIKE